MTEDEAKTKWCPLANQAVVSAFRIITPAGAGSGAHTLCIGSACMAWRWAGYRTEAGHWVKMTPGEPFEVSRASGGCGLAGSPQ